MSDGIVKDDLALVEKFARLLSYKATMMHGAEWDALLAADGLTDATFSAAYGQLARRFGAEPALAAAYAKFYQEQCEVRFREAAERKGMDADPRIAGSVWNAVHDIQDKAEAFAQQYRRPQGVEPQGYAPDLESIARAVSSGDPEIIAQLLDDPKTVSIVDWREAPLDIIEILACRLPDGTLTLAELSPEQVTVASGERTASITLEATPSDKEAMLRACEQVLRPEYELRVCLDSYGSDTLAFVCLSREDWRALERAHGERLHAHFGVLEGRALFD